MSDVLMVALILSKFEESWLLAPYAGRLEPYAELIARVANETELPPTVVVGVILMESSGNANAVNPKSKACGLGGIMPSDAVGRDDTETARYRKIFALRPTCEELLDPDLNLHYMSLILQHIAKHDNPNQACLVIRDYSGHANSSDGVFEAKYWFKFQAFFLALDVLEDFGAAADRIEADRDAKRFLEVKRVRDKWRPGYR